MLSELVAKLMPHLSFIIYAEVMLLCMAILAGCFFVLKKILTRPTFEGDPAYDYERIAQEIEQEIARLENLRLRLGGKKGLSTHDLENIKGDPSMIGAKPMSTQELDSLVEERYKAQFDQLKAELQKSAAEGGGASGNEEGKKLKTENAKLAEEIKALKSSGGAGGDDSALLAKIAHLEKIIEEYQVFEEDFALAKKYKSEAEALRGQIQNTTDAPGVVQVPKSALAAQVTEADIASMFGDLSSGPAVEPAPAVVEKSAMSSESVAPTESAAFASEAVKAEPSVAAASPENKEALAESAATDDRLIAEFEKLLSGDNKS